MNGDGCNFSCIVETVAPTPIFPSAPSQPTCNPQGIQIQSKKMNDKYYLTWEPVLNAKEYIIYRSDQATQSTQQMAVV